MNSNKDIQKWMKWLKIILKTYDKCRNILGKMIRQKNKLNESGDRQKKDDMLFYNSILKDSIYFYKKSLEIRRYKFIKDISEMNQFFNKDRFPLEDVNTTIFIEILQDYYKELLMENGQDLQWIKDDNLVSLIEWKKDMSFTLNYHYYIMTILCPKAILTYSHWNYQNGNYANIMESGNTD